MKRWDIINKLIKKHGYTSYLEIGAGDNDTFNRVQIESKTGVDPNGISNEIIKKTSDEFFLNNSQNYDIIFIDGLHVYEQVKKDLLNSLNALNDNGTIVMHDCNPTTYEMQRTDTTISGEWTGDVWRVIVEMKRTKPNLDIFVVDTDYGCGVIRLGNQQLIECSENIDYFEFEKNKNYFLNLVSTEKFIEL
jgi:hypothetical protein